MGRELPGGEKRRKEGCAEIGEETGVEEWRGVETRREERQGASERGEIGRCRVERPGWVLPRDEERRGRVLPREERLAVAEFIGCRQVKRDWLGPG